MPKSTVRTIRLRWRGRCCVCGEEVAAGVSARWDSSAHTVTCLPCAAAKAAPGKDERENATTARGRQEPSALAIGVAGASALREYTRRHDARERHARERAGVLGVWLARLGGDPQSTHAWKQGADGEAKTAKRLAKLLDGTGVYLLHDRRAPGRISANIDHIAVGPGGITVIDAKALNGKVSVESVGWLFGPPRRRLRVNGSDRTRLIYGVRAQAEGVRSLLAQHGVTTEVRCALCFANVNGLPWFRHLDVEGVPVDGPRRIAKLANRPGSLPPQEVRRLVRLLAKSLPAA